MHQMFKIKKHMPWNQRQKDGKFKNCWQSKKSDKEKNDSVKLDGELTQNRKQDKIRMKTEYREIELN